MLTENGKKKATRGRSASSQDHSSLYFPPTKKMEINEKYEERDPFQPLPSAGFDKGYAAMKRRKKISMSRSWRRKTSLKMKKGWQCLRG